MNYEEHERIAIIADGCRVSQEEAAEIWKCMKAKRQDWKDAVDGLVVDKVYEERR